MSSVIEKVKKLAQGRQFILNKSDYIFQRVSFKNDKFVVYEVMNKNKPLYTISEEKFEEEWTHSTVIRVTKLPDDEEKIKALLDLYEVRKSINYDECPDLVKFYDQGLTQYGNDIFYFVRYDDPIRTFDHFINIDCKDEPLEVLDCFRLIRGALLAFEYLEKNGYVLAQFDDQNYYVGSFSEDRGCFFKVMFKGYKDKNVPTNLFKSRHKFSPPETESHDIYKSYAFSAGLMALYAIYATNKKVDIFPKNLFKDVSKLKEIMNVSADLLYSKGDSQNKSLFIYFMQELLEPELEKRESPEVLLKHKYIIECDKLDYNAYLTEIEENAKEKQKLKAEEEEIFG